MQMNDVKQRIDRVEQCADEAEQAIQQSASVSSDLRQCLDTMHQQARQAQQMCASQPQQQQGGQQQSGQQQGSDTGQLRQVVMQLEESGDKAMDACRRAGNVDPQVQQAVQRAHAEASSLKKQIQMG